MFLLLWWSNNDTNVWFLKGIRHCSLHPLQWDSLWSYSTGTDSSLGSRFSHLSCLQSSELFQTSSVRSKMAAMLRPLGIKLSGTRCLPSRCCSSFVSRTRSSNSWIHSLIVCWLIVVFIDWWFSQVREPAEGGRRGLSGSTAEQSHFPLPPFGSSAATHTERNPRT